MLDCKHASRLVSQSMERPLSLRERLGLRLHLLLCRACARFSRQLALMHQAVEQWRRRLETDTQLTLSADARRRIAASIESQVRQHPGQDPGG